MAPICLILRPRRQSWRQTAEFDRPSGFRAGSFEAIEEQLLYTAGGSLLLDTDTILHTQTRFYHGTIGGFSGMPIHAMWTTNVLGGSDLGFKIPPG